MRNPVATANKKTGLWQPYKYLVVRESTSASTPMYCINQKTREIEYEGTTAAPEAVIQYALDNALRSSIRIADGNYTMSAGFTGLTFSQEETTLDMRGVLLNVPQNYAGSCLILNNVGLCHVRGGRLDENGTPAKLWTAIDLNVANGNRITNCTFDNMYLRHCLNGIRLKTDTLGWCNVNAFNKIYIDTCVVGVLFEHVNAYTDASSGSNTNQFDQVLIQYSSGVTHGFKDINGRRNMFLNCNPTDFTGSAISMSISANARNTQIIGGTCTAKNFSDLQPIGSRSFIIDEFAGSVNHFGNLISAMANFPTAVPSFGQRKWGRYNAFGSVVGEGIFNATTTAIASGTGAVTGAIRSSTGLRYRHTTGATANSLAGNRVTGTLICERDLNPWTEWRILLSTVANMRCVMGYTSSTGAPASAADPLANLSGVMFFYDSAVSANWKICQNDGSASSDTTTIANVAAADANLHTFALRADNANAKFQYSYDGGAWVDINTKIPAATTGLGPLWYLENLSGTVTMDTWYVQHIQDA